MGAHLKKQIISKTLVLKTIRLLSRQKSLLKKGAASGSGVRWKTLHQLEGITGES